MSADPPPFPPHARVGEWSMVLGLVALVFAFVPVAGELVAVPAALLAVAAGVVGLVRAGRLAGGGLWPSLSGIVLGLTAVFVLFVVVVAAG